MQLMHVGDEDFSKLLGRWIMQSEFSYGKSGGRSNVDTDSVHKQACPQASFEPFKSKTWFSKFPKSWMKQEAFNHAEPNLAVIFTAMAQKYGKDWPVYGNSAQNWYRIAQDDMRKMRPHIEKLIKMLRSPAYINKIPVLYGRDCIHLFRLLRSVKDLPQLAYVEGVSRHTAGSESSAGWADPIKNKSVLRDFLVKNIAGGQFQNHQLLHIDTGFSGTIPKACIRALDGEFVHAKHSNQIMMLSSSTEQWNLGMPRNFVIKFETRPKIFFRPCRWVRNPNHSWSNGIDAYVDESHDVAASAFDPKFYTPTSNGQNTVTFNTVASKEDSLQSSGWIYTTTSVTSSIANDICNNAAKIKAAKANLHQKLISKKYADEAVKTIEDSIKEDWTSMYIPDLRVTGDVINSAAYLIGLVAAAKHQGVGA